MIYWIAYVITKFVALIFFPRRVIGFENLPKKGGFIVASNHLSYLDPQIIGMCMWRRFSYVAKDSLFKNEFASFILHQVGAFPIKRDTSDFRGIREILRRLKMGCPVVIFPEGTRGVGGRAKKPQQGIGLVAVKSKVPVIPCFVSGSDKVLPPGAKFFKRHLVTVTFGKPMHFSEDQSYSTIASLIVDQIYTLSSAP